MYKIQTITAGSAVASLDFTVPSGYDDLLVVISGRASGSPDIYMTINGSTANMSRRDLYGDGVNAGSSSASDNYIGFNGWSSATANTFASLQLYISNYLSSNAKSYSVESVYENNATQAGQRILAGLWNQTAAITSLSFTTNGNFVQGSTATLYGIRKYNTTATPKATGGIITYANGYWVHTFTASGTFTPTQNLTCEYLVIAGGGAGGAAGNGAGGGGGGAGGYRSSVSGESSGANSSAESALSLTSATNYTVTIGAGGTGSSSTAPTSGSNSTFSTVTSTGGGRGGTWISGAGNINAENGGSGGGAGYGNIMTKGNGTANQGTNGGDGVSSGSYPGGGGGGASTAGQNAPSSSVAGSGGAGLASLITGISMTRAGGGGAGIWGNTAGSGGSGGGGAGSNSGTGSAATMNTGSGGGGGAAGGSTSSAGGNGGSGVVIIRYAA